MGYATYSTSNAISSRVANNTYTASLDSIFVQNTLRTIYQGLDPKGVLVRECLDSEQHPQTLPIIMALDVTGSMSRIPHELIKDGLPTLMGKITQRVPDASLMFLAIGDAYCDKYPLQAAQFESGDAELDHWLTHTYLEGGGGGNIGESYPLAWYFAAFHTSTDHWNKRKKKGFLFTIGDEPCVDLTKPQIEHIMGNSVQSGYQPSELLTEAQKKYDVWHLHVLEGSAGRRSLGYWEELLGDHCIPVKDYKKIPEILADTVVANSKPVITEEEILL